MPDTPLTNEGLLELLINVMREDKKQRHHTANVAQTALDTATANGRRIESLETRMTALLGDGTGSNGRIAELATIQRQTQADMGEVKTSMKQIAGSIDEMKKVTEDSKGALSGGRAIVWAIGALSTVLTVIGAVVGGVLWLYKH